MTTNSNRRGAASVEAALMLPLLIIVTFGAIDVSQYINAGQVIANASREGARVGSRESTETVEQIEAAIFSYLSQTIPQMSEPDLEDCIDIEVRKVVETDNGHSKETIPSGDLNKIDSGAPMSVRVQLNFSALRWLRGPEYNPLDTETYCCRE
jgi:hypothetical protein